MDQLDLAFAHFRNLEEPEVFVDLRSLLEASLKNFEAAEYDEATRTVHLKTHRANVWVTLAPDRSADDFAVSRFLMRGQQGALIELSDVRLGPQVEGQLRLENRAVEELDVPLRTLGPEIGQSILLVAPANLGQKAQERHAAEQLGSLFDR